MWLKGFRNKITTDIWLFLLTIFVSLDTLKKKDGRDEVHAASVAIDIVASVIFLLFFFSRPPLFTILFLTRNIFYMYLNKV
jgi:hypothetical protein